jgi:hypothetical protein
VVGTGRKLEEKASSYRHLCVRFGRLSDRLLRWPVVAGTTGDKQASSLPKKGLSFTGAKGKRRHQLLHLAGTSQGRSFVHWLWGGGGVD